MRIASIPLNEEFRLQDLYSYDILNSESETDFNDLLEVVANIYGCPMAAISFIDKERQWLKAKKGINEKIREAPRDIAFCAHTILEQEIMIVEDATQDERFHDNPFVTEDLFIRFYAGVPIVSAAGFKLGTVCVLDSEPRKLTPEAGRTLKIIAKQISKLLELRLKNKILKQSAQELLQIEKILLQKTLQEQEHKSFSISTELHENIAQGLAATKFYLELAEEGSVAKDDLIRKSKENIKGLIQEVRKLSISITPTTLKESNLKDLLQGLIKQFHDRTAIEAVFHYEGHEEVHPDLAIALYRIVEDGLENIKEHSKATHATIYVNAYENINVFIEDDGMGIDSKTFKKGIGINKILSRIEHFNGFMDISIGASGGCRLSLTIPIQINSEYMIRTCSK